MLNANDVRDRLTALLARCEIAPAVDIPTDSVEYNVRMAIEEIDRLRAENEKIREFARTLLKQIRGDDAES